MSAFLFVISSVVTSTLIHKAHGKQAVHTVHTPVMRMEQKHGASEVEVRVDDSADNLQESLEQECVPQGMRVAHVSAEGNTFRMVVLGENDIVSKELLHNGFWEIAGPTAMAAKGGTSIKDNSTLLDIGANIGYYSLVFAAHGHHVLAVEPMSRNRAALKGSLCLNPSFKDLVRVVPAALVSPEELKSNTHCVIRSTNADINIGNGQLNCKEDAKPCAVGDANCENVPVKTLDMILAENALAKIDVVKMDVEAHECQVFEGGKTLFEKYHPHLLQVETAWGNGGQCVHEKAQKYNYMTKRDDMNTEMVEGSRHIQSFLQLS